MEREREKMEVGGRGEKYTASRLACRGEECASGRKIKKYLNLVEERQ